MHHQYPYYDSNVIMFCWVWALWLWNPAMQCKLMSMTLQWQFKKSCHITSQIVCLLKLMNYIYTHTLTQSDIMQCKNRNSFMVDMYCRSNVFARSFFIASEQLTSHNSTYPMKLIVFTELSCKLGLFTAHGTQHNTTQEDIVCSSDNPACGW